MKDARDGPAPPTMEPWELGSPTPSQQRRLSLEPRGHQDGASEASGKGERPSGLRGSLRWVSPAKPSRPTAATENWILGLAASPSGSLTSAVASERGVGLGRERKLRAGRASRRMDAWVAGALRRHGTRRCLGRLARRADLDSQTREPVPQGGLGRLTTESSGSVLRRPQKPLSD